jgi:hypothetical protein
MSDFSGTRNDVIELVSVRVYEGRSLKTGRPSILLASRTADGDGFVFALPLVSAQQLAAQLVQLSNKLAASDEAS